MHLPCGLTSLVGCLRQECGHDPEDDDALFSTEQQQQHGPGLFAAVAQEGMSPGTTLLAYDERMTLHEEDAASPHPERPDRIRAVIARLLSTGLAGEAFLNKAAQLSPARLSTLSDSYFW